MQTATIGGGCFWCVEATLEQLNGVQKVVSGYAGGHTVNPDYKSVCTGTTGHAEVVQVTFDADIISYEMLLKVFMTTHDPTTLNRQGGDVGTQYRSVIFYENEAQKNLAEKVISELEGYYEKPIVTSLEKLEKFYRAEDYHQNYYDQNKNEGYCMMVINPKLSKLRKQYAHLLKK